MDTQQLIHDYHLLVDAELKQKIYDLQEFGDWSFTDSTRFILKTCAFLAYAYFQVIRKLQSAIPAVMDDKVDAHIYFPVSEYRFLKEKHGMRNTFSVAVIVRTAIRLFLEGVDKYGYKMFVEMMKKLKESMDRELQKRIWSIVHENGRHMSVIYEKQTQLFAEFLLRMAYNLLM